jgi:hypothetical protein
MKIPSERALILSATRMLATDLFACGKNWEGCKAMVMLGWLLDKRTVSRENVREIRRLAKLVL